MHFDLEGIWEGEGKFWEESVLFEEGEPEFKPRKSEVQSDSDGTECVKEE